MPRTTVATTLLPRIYESANLDSGNPSNVPFTAVDVANGNQFDSTGRELILVYNPNAVEATFTVKAVNDQFGRAVDIVNKFMQGTLILGPIQQDGFRQSDGKVYIDATANLQVAILRLAVSPIGP